MSLPIDQLVVDWIVDRLEQIQTANGYRTNAGTHVIDEEAREDIPADAIALIVLDLDEQLQDQKRTHRTARLSVDVIAYIPDGDHPDARARGRLVLADIRQAISSAPCLPGEAGAPPQGVTDLALGARSLPVRAEGSGQQTATITIAATYSERHTPPN